MILKTGMKMRTIGVAGVLAFASVALPASVASATVHVDPNGPAGQQYALPLDSVRGQASGNPASGVPGAAEAPPLFGQGVTKGKQDHHSDNGGNGKAGEPAKHRPAGSPKPLNRRAINAVLASDAGGSTTTWMLGLMAAVLAVGAIGGLLLRRGPEPKTDSGRKPAE